MTIVVYCVMPDHIHLLVDGDQDGADLRAFMKLAKQRAGFRFKQQYRRPLWEDGYYEHVPRIWGLSVIDDQNVGGALMLVEQSIVLLTALVILFVRMLAQSEEDERRRERLEDAAPA